MSEPTMEEKAIIIMAEQALEIAIRSCTFRWLFCWNGEKDQSCFDCACCLSWDDSLHRSLDCGCICHKRIDELKALFRAAFRSKEKHNKSWFWDRGLTGAIRTIEKTA